MNLDLPTPGDDSGVWDDKLNAALEAVGAHDHTPGKGVKVPTAGLNVNADLAFGGNAATNLKASQYLAQASAPALNRSTYVKTDENFYFRNAAGVEVQITNGNGLDVTQIGGITGDYAATDASLYYDDATKEYRAYADESPLTWASIACGDVVFFRKSAGGSQNIRFAAPAALASSFTLTLPEALPAATSLVQSSSSGGLSFNGSSNRVAVFAAALDANGAVTFTGTVSLGAQVGAFTATGAATFAAAAEFSDAATFSAAVNLGTQVAAFAATGNITAPDYRHTSSQRLLLQAGSFNTMGTVANMAPQGNQLNLSTHTGSSSDPTAICPVPLKNGDRIKQVNVYLEKLSGAGTLRVRLMSYHVASNSLTDHGLNSTGSMPGGALAIGSGESLDVSVDAGKFYWIQVEGGGTTGDRVFGAEVFYTRP